MASSRFGKHWLDSAGTAYRRIGVAISGAYADRASAPTITAGTAAPTSTSQAEGSLYIRTSTVIGLYQYRSAAWVLVLGAGAALPSSSSFLSAEVTGTGSSQDTAHGLGAVPTLVFAIPSNLTGGVAVVTYGTHDATNAKVTMTTGEKYRVVAFK